MTTREQLIEAMARAMCDTEWPTGTYDRHLAEGRYTNRDEYTRLATAALDAALPGLAEHVAAMRVAGCSTPQQARHLIAHNLREMGKQK